MPPLNKTDATELLGRRHPEWVEFQKQWRWLNDSLEGGERYKHADYFRGPFDPSLSPWYAYGFDATTGEGLPFMYGQIVERNLVPKLSEMSNENRDLYVLRLNRTPVPRYVEFVIRRYLSRIYSKQIKRTGPKALEGWWNDVDGRGTPALKWIRKVVAPLLLSLGQIDLVFGHPEGQPGDELLTRADVKRLGLDQCRASYILPENLVWWKLDRDGRNYVEVLAHERDEATGASRWRHWVGNESNCYDAEGDCVTDRSFTHSFGRVPIARIFDDRNLRTKHVGKSRMGVVAELQKSIYNRRSELILSDVMHMHPVLQGPEEYLTATGSVKAGVGSVLPMKKWDDGAGYTGWSFVEAPQVGAEECRQHILDDVDEIMQMAALLKPAGSTDGKTVAQSGVSKSFDAREGNDLLSEVAQTIQEAEELAAEFALAVLTDGKASDKDVESIECEYPVEFDLFSASDLSQVLADLQELIAAAGGLPETEGEILKRLISVLLPGLDEERLGTLHKEIDDAVAQAAKTKDQEAEANAGAGAMDGALSTTDPAQSLPNGAGLEAQQAAAMASPVVA
jgi:hypothetical protein